jgi:hypothetical protein
MPTVRQIYQNLKILPNLQEHQLKVAAVGQYLAKNLKTKGGADLNLILSALLFHDIGNIIKFRLEKFKHFLGAEQERVKYWQKIKSRYILKYGSDEHQASVIIAKNLKLSPGAVELIKKMGTSHLKKIYRSKDVNLKICSYSDLRVGPERILPVNERFDDLIKRYGQTSHSIGNLDQTELNRQYCLKIEKQLQADIAKDLKNINDKLIQPQLKALASIRLEDLNNEAD